jgi:uncharacterized protein YcbX
MGSLPTITALRFYPVKSCGAVILERGFAGKRGLESEGVGDRRWMLIDQEGIMVTQRQIPELARVRVALEAGKVALTADGREKLLLEPGRVEGGQERFILHRHSIVGHRAPAAASAWFSEFLGFPVRLMHQTDDDIRTCNPLYTLDPEEDRVGFADAFPYLVVTEATLARVNGYLDRPVPMDRFRPNIVIGNCPADAEYGWRRIAAGEAEFALVKPSDRCVMTTIDQKLGVKTGKEPLAALAKHYFLSDGLIQGAIFGENTLPLRLGEIAVGDTVSVIATKPPHLFRQ